MADKKEVRCSDWKICLDKDCACYLPHTYIREGGCAEGACASIGYKVKCVRFEEPEWDE